MPGRLPTLGNGTTVFIIGPFILGKEAGFRPRVPVGLAKGAGLIPTGPAEEPRDPGADRGKGTWPGPSGPVDLGKVAGLGPCKPGALGKLAGLGPSGPEALGKVAGFEPWKPADL